MRKIIGIDIGGTKCAVILGVYKVEGNVDIIQKVQFSTDKLKGPYYVIEKLCSIIEEMLNNHQIELEELEGIGISCGGPLDSEKGIILSPPNLIGWDEVPIVKILTGRFNTKVRLQNDANACALAEWRFGAAKGYRNVVFLTFGTGLGAGLILDGRLYNGTNGMAGEIGHIRLEGFGPVGYGKAGSFEGFCSGGGIAQLARLKALERLQQGEKVSFCEGVAALEQITAKLVADAAQAGDSLAREIYRISGHYLGRGLSILIDLLNPEVIVIGSIYQRNSQLLWEEAEKVIEKEALALSKCACTIVPAKLGDVIGDYAALALAVEE